MKELKIKLNTISDVKKFVIIVFKYEFDVDMVSGRYSVDAKSLLGLFSLDLSQEVTLRIHSDDCNELLSEIKEFEA
jgi:phosphotransferase system HPr-like phosphotransfer protein